MWLGIFLLLLLIPKSSQFTTCISGGKIAYLARLSTKQSHVCNLTSLCSARTEIKESIVSNNNKKRSNQFIDIPYASAVEVLRTYKSIKGDLAIPRQYIVPSSNLFSQDWHGINLSKAIYNMKWWQNHVASHSDRVAELNSLGFLWDRLQPEWNLILEALMVFKLLYPSLDGSLLVPSAFVIPFGDNDFPQATWGLHLGNQVYRIRSRHDFIRGKPDRIVQLNGLRFVWDVSEYNFQKVVRAISLYTSLVDQKKSINSKINRVPSNFVIPQDSNWPKDLWGFPLGMKCCAIRTKQLYVKNHPQRKETLQNMGFLFLGNSAVGWLEVVHAAAIYSELHDKTLSVPQAFIVPKPPILHHSNTSLNTFHFSDWPWPEYLWGLPLGQRLRDVRAKKRYLTGESASSRIAQLDALGFEWNPKRGRSTLRKTS